MRRPFVNPQRVALWREHLARWSSGGLSVSVYCHRHGLNLPSFYAWRRTIAQRDRSSGTKPSLPKPKPTPAFLPVAVVDAPRTDASSAIDIYLADGHRVRVRSGCDRQLLGDVLALLRTPAAKEARPC